MLSRQTRSLTSSKITSGSGPQVQLDLVADGDVLDRLGDEEATGRRGRCCGRRGPCRRAAAWCPASTPCRSASGTCAPTAGRTPARGSGTGSSRGLDAASRLRMRFDQPLGTVSVPSIVKMKYSLRPSLMISLGWLLRLHRPDLAPRIARRCGMTSLAASKRQLRLDRPCPSLSTSSIGNPGQLGDLLDEVDLAHHQPHLGVLVLLARVVRHPDEALEVRPSSPPGRPPARSRPTS